MRTLSRVVVALVLMMSPVIFSALDASAETYRGIVPLDTLGDLKKKFPGATFTRRHPALAQRGDVVYSIEGPSISGTIVVTSYEPKANETATDDDVEVSRVRWIPHAPIPLARFVFKYGEPQESGFAGEDLEPYRHWVKG